MRTKRQSVLISSSCWRCPSFKDGWCSGNTLLGNCRDGSCLDDRLCAYYLSPNEISLKKAFKLFQSMESMLERDAGEERQSVLISSSCWRCPSFKAGWCSGNTLLGNCRDGSCLDARLCADYLSPNEISLKKAIKLFRLMESMLEQDAAEADVFNVPESMPSSMDRTVSKLLFKVVAITPVGPVFSQPL
ncbi:hypothetical protein KUCAC02_017847, partial [Chaenocephalus aceratus]